MLHNHCNSDLWRIATRWYAHPTSVLNTGGNENEGVRSCVSFPSGMHMLKVGRQMSCFVWEDQRISTMMYFPVGFWNLLVERRFKHILEAL